MIWVEIEFDIWIFIDHVVYIVHWLIFDSVIMHSKTFCLTWYDLTILVHFKHLDAIWHSLKQ